jgi:hypothetical protein
MKSIICILFSILLVNGCSSPTDIEAWRHKIDENPEPESTAAIKFATKFLDFGFITQQTTFSIDLPIHNISLVDTVKIKSLTLVSGKRGFRIPHAENLPIELLPGKRTAIKKVLVEFNPKVPGEFLDTLFVNGDKNKYVVLRGLSGESNNVSSVDIQNIDFGEVVVGTSKDITTEIKNNEGNNGLYVMIEGLPSDDNPFTIITPPGEYLIPPGSSRSFLVRYMPKERQSDIQLMKFYIRSANGQLNSTFTVRGKGI